MSAYLKKVGDNFVYYLNDGIYGSFNCVYFDHTKPIIQPYNERDGKLYDSIDIIAENSNLAISFNLGVAPIDIYYLQIFLNFVDVYRSFCPNNGEGSS